MAARCSRRAPCAPRREASGTDAQVEQSQQAMATASASWTRLRTKKHDRHTNSSRPARRHLGELDAVGEHLEEEAAHDDPVFELGLGLRPAVVEQGHALEKDQVQAVLEVLVVERPRRRRPSSVTVGHRRDRSRRTPWEWRPSARDVSASASSSSSSPSRGRGLRGTPRGCPRRRPARGGPRCRAPLRGWPRRRAPRWPAPRGARGRARPRCSGPRRPPGASPPVSWARIPPRRVRPGRHVRSGLGRDRLVLQHRTTGAGCARPFFVGAWSRGVRTGGGARSSARAGTRPVAVLTSFPIKSRNTGDLVAKVTVAAWRPTAPRPHERRGAAGVRERSWD